MSSAFPSVRQTGLSEADAKALQELERLLGQTMAAHILQAHAAFERDLPQLLQEKPDQWVAYRGGQRLAVGSTKTAVYQDCLARGLAYGEFVVFFVEPLMPREIDLPVDV